jgi:hypothetical protein
VVVTAGALVEGTAVSVVAVVLVVDRLLAFGEDEQAATTATPRAAASKLRGEITAATVAGAGVATGCSTVRYGR